MYSKEVKRFCPSRHCCSGKSANNGKSSVCIADEISKNNEKLDNLARYRNSSEIEREKVKIRQYIQEAQAEQSLNSEPLIMQMIANSDWKK